MSSSYSRLAIFLSVSIISAVIHSATAATQLDPLPINSQDGTRLGYAHVFKPAVQNNNVSTTAEPIVYLPGFDINLADLIENSSTNEQGTRAGAVKSIRELVFTQSPHPTSRHPQLLESLVNDYGHTLVVLEYENDQAGVEHNAQAVEAVLTDPRLPVMKSYQSTGTRSLLLGWSMGGLIGRYALTKMESEGVEHNIGLYISYDAPHQGANLPLSFEAFVALMRQIIAEQSSTPNLATFDNLLNAAQTKYNSLSGSEMLKPYLGIPKNASVLNTLRNRYDLIYNDSANSAAGEAFYSVRNQLSTLGQYPTRLKKIGISNGNFLGNPLTLPMPRNGNELVRLTAQIPITQRFKLEVMDIRLYDNSSGRARSNCRINYFFRTTLCPLLMMPNNLHNLSAGVGSHTNVVARLASVFENQQALQGEWLNQGYRVEFDAVVSPGEGLTTFIPMDSALDFHSPDTNPATVVAEQTPFDAIYANSVQNRSHNAVSPEIFNALIFEIAQNRQERTVIQSLPAIY